MRRSRRSRPAFRTWTPLVGRVAAALIGSAMPGMVIAAGVVSAAPSVLRAPTSIAACAGPPLTRQSQVHANTSYCGGRATSQIRLANGDTWEGGEVTGVSTGSQEGAVECGTPCTLLNMDIHDNPNAFAGIYASMAKVIGPVTISGGRVTNNGSLGIGGSVADPLTVRGVEIDHNGATGSCVFEAGGFKGINHHLRFTGNNVHDNNCPGVWVDVGAGGNGSVEIDHNTITNNANEGIMYEV
ncbi:MAG TPA: right-handed parallel beta-helix repeat-containing protein, partial [Candidatus Dormibacteraeota bacterium]